MTNLNDNHNAHLETDLHPLHEQLEDLGHEYAQRPDSGFESRVLSAISTQIAPQPLPLNTQPEESKRAKTWFPLSFAAGIAIIAGVTIFAQKLTVTQPGLPNPETHALVALEESIDALDELTSFAEMLDEDLDEIDYLTDSLDTELAVPSVFLELAESSLTEGSL